jgi:hypothetical protein
MIIEESKHEKEGGKGQDEERKIRQKRKKRGEGRKIIQRRTEGK